MRVSPKTLLRGLLEAAEGKLFVFDIDDTLLSTSARHGRILREFAGESGHKALGRIEPSQMSYRIVDTAKRAGFTDAKLLEELRKFWFDRFFTHEYLLEDRPVAGAREFCGQALAAGARIVYLTGRDETMRQGTVDTLLAHGFPAPGQEAELVLKPRFDIDDEIYKAEAVQRVRALGPVAAAFDNEPVHANLFARSFAAAKVFLVGAWHSGKPVRPEPGILPIPDFLI